MNPAASTSKCPLMFPRFTHEQAAWSAYKRARYQRREHVEPTAKVDAMLAISERLPVHFEVSASVHGSSMNPHSGAKPMRLEGQHQRHLSSCFRYNAKRER